MNVVEMITIIFHSMYDLTGMLFNVCTSLSGYLSDTISIQGICYSDWKLGSHGLLCLPHNISYTTKVVLVPVGTGLIYFYYGPCRIIGAQFCYITYCAMLSCCIHSLYSLLLSFSFRYYVLRWQHPSAESLKLTIFFISTPSILVFVRSSQFHIIGCFANEPASELLTILAKELPYYDIANATIAGHTSVFEWKLLTGILLIATPITPILVSTLVLKRQIVALLSTHPLSENTKILHKQLLEALTYQALLPSLFFISLLCYLCIQSGLYRHPILESFTMIFIGSFPVLSPLMSLYFIKPYRTHISQHLLIACRKKRAMGETNSKVLSVSVVAH
ncbi:7TM chemoreceptor [Cooperia oncophora]